MPDYRELKNRTRISSTLDNDIYKMLKEYSAKSDIPITKILDKAVSAYIRSQVKSPKCSE
jgi:hypothetical protein